jgi:hypothetical protein
VSKPAKKISRLKVKEFHEPGAMSERPLSVISMDRSIYSRMEADHKMESFVQKQFNHHLHGEGGIMETMEIIFEVAETLGKPFKYYQKQNLRDHCNKTHTELLLQAVHHFKDAGSFQKIEKTLNEFKNKDFDAITIITGIKSDRRGHITVFSSLLKYIKNKRFNLNQNQFDFFMKKLEKENISIVAIYEAFLADYNFDEFCENLFIMHQGMHVEKLDRSQIDSQLIDQ